MGAITNKIFELLENAGQYEERRSTGIIINSNWFDAVFGEDERSRTTRFHSKAGNYFEDSSDRIKAKKSNLAINDIP